MATQQVKQEPRSELNMFAIQGDVLVGLQKDAEVFAFFQIVEVAAFRAALVSLLPAITSAATAAEREEMLALNHAAPVKQRFPFTAFNIGFTFAGLQKLAGGDFANGTTLDASFIAGPVSRAESLGDRLGDWKRPFVDGQFDGVLLITGPDTTLAETHRDTIVATFGAAIRIVYEEMGKTRPPQRGHEHFGFLDGVSQPGVLGFTEENPQRPGQGFPGQDLIPAGEFIFGYPDVAGEGKSKPPLPWMQDGSYMVFRRLEQQVLGFRQFVRDAAAAHGMDERLLAARMVGRWPSGAPVALAPLQDDAGLGGDPKANNDFEFDDDQFQRRCPFAAHIRKTYPRKDIDEDDVEVRRIRRAGIPFGDEVDTDAEAIGSEASRGLMFVCYQTSRSSSSSYSGCGSTIRTSFSASRGRTAAR